MQRRTAMIGLAAAAPALGTRAAEPASEGAQVLRQRVAALVAAYETAWNAGDMTSMGRLYTSKVHWVNIMGMHWQGFEDVDYAHRALFDTVFAGVASRLENIESVEPLPGGGAVAVIRWQVAAYTSPSGQAFPASRSRMSLTLVPQDGELRIAHGANIQIVEAAQRSDPVVRRGPREVG